MPNRSNGAGVTPIREPLDFPLEKRSISYKGVAYTFRELTLAENDACRDAATGPDETFDGRTMMRTMIVTSAVEPELTMDDLGKFPARLYSRIVDLVNDLNDADKLDEDEDPGKS